jgi:hypothetical protein
MYSIPVKVIEIWRNVSNVTGDTWIIIRGTQNACVYSPADASISAYSY